MSALNFKRQVTDQPWVISSLDPAVAGYLAGLSALDVFSNTAGQQWGFTIDTLEGDLAGGTAYLVSAAAKARIESGRYAA